jgi:hypothetical protein
MIKSRRMKWAEHVACMRKIRVVYSTWWGNLRERGDLRKPTRRCEDNIKINLQEVGCGGTDWIDLAQDRDRWRELVNAVMNFRVL